MKRKVPMLGGIGSRSDQYLLTLSMLAWATPWASSLGSLASGLRYFYACVTSHMPRGSKICHNSSGTATHPMLTQYAITLAPFIDDC
ncbi:hypothetical protein JTZ10_00005 [Gordonia rubripertincta]|uniref:Secreted protein n=1 Tax=Gordonia rubripertincta TaxID=36822 RepID=A0AAW4FYU2_GORRU|nr:hypothetical protein [Gordonia rubripertincta]MBM7276131.1 hypothetical protein [Gordonia rubripertincta]